MCNETRYKRAFAGIVLSCLLAIFCSGCFLAASPEKIVLANAKRSLERRPESGQFWNSYSYLRAINKFVRDNIRLSLKSVITEGKTSTVILAMEMYQHDVLSDAITADGLEDKSESEVYQYLEDNKSVFSTTPYDIEYKLQKEKGRWHIISPKEPDQKELDKRKTDWKAMVREYLSKIAVRNIEVRDLCGDKRLYEIHAEVKNLGDKNITRVVLEMKGLDAKGKPVFDKRSYPVGADTSEVLKPNYSIRFTETVVDPPSDWAEKVSFEVVDIILEE